MSKDKKQNSDPKKNNECVCVESVDEAEVVVRLLESALKTSECFSISAPEVGIDKRVAIIRAENIQVDLVNPKIIQSSNKVTSLAEGCYSYETSCFFFNCFRYDKVIIENGFDKKQYEFKGKLAHIIQHEIDHLNGIECFHRKIKLAIVRENGVILLRDYCPCGSRKRFDSCCLHK